MSAQDVQSLELKELLKDSRVVAITTVRRRAADKAAKAQDIYNKNGSYFIVAGGIATVAGALILLSTGGEGSAELKAAAARGEEVLMPETLVAVQAALAQPLVRSLLFVLEVLALGIAAYCGEILRTAKSDVTWISERREAEIGRIKLHETILACAQERDPSGSLTYELAAFDYFVVDQLQKQISYHAKKETAATKSSWKTIRVGAAIAAIVAAVGATGTLGLWWIVIGAFVGVIAPVLMHGLSKYRELKMDRERTESSANMWKVLQEIAGRIDVARAKLDAGDPSLARQMIADTHTAMKAENEAWMPTKSPI